MRRRFLNLAMGLAAIGAVAVAAPHPVGAQDAPAPPAANPAPAPVIIAPGPEPEAIRARLAREFGLPVATLSDGADLVADVGIDQTQVFYGVQTVLEEYGITKQPKELTRVGDIIEAIVRFTAVEVKKRTFATATTTSYTRIVFYATDRKPTGDTSPQTFFGGERALAGALSYGHAKVNIPYNHKPGQIETPWTSLGQSNDPRKHLYVLSLEPTSEGQFYTDIAALNAGAGDILVYVHGFNTSFDEAIVRAGQIAFDFDFKGAPVVFSWPSYRSVAGYNSDQENVYWATRHIEQFLTKIVAEAKGRKVHLVAHSMGTKGVLNALRLIANRGAPKAMFQSVILCAPDFDAGLFREQIAAEVKPLASQWVVYASNKDLALMASEKLNTAPRLGTPVTYAEGFEIIDASEVEVTPWSVPETHSYYAAKKVVLDDMVRVLAGVGASARGLKARVVGADTVWQFVAAPAAATPPQP